MFVRLLALFVSLGTVACLALAPAPAVARPVSSVGTTTVEASAEPDRYDAEVHYTVTRALSLGVGYHRFQHDAGEVQYGEGHVGLLLWRKNRLHRQSNLFAVAGYGGAVLDAGGATEESHGGRWMVQLDTENRRTMVAVNGFGLSLANGEHDLGVGGMAGIAPYVVGYEGVQMWLMASGAYVPDRPESWMLVPHMRVMYRSALVELGADVRGGYYIGFVAEF